jgi:hypothetical protein
VDKQNRFIFHIFEQQSTGEHNYKEMCGKILFRNKFFKETEHTRFKKFIKVQNIFSAAMKYSFCTVPVLFALSKSSVLIKIPLEPESMQNENTYCKLSLSFLLFRPSRFV